MIASDIAHKIITYPHGINIYKITELLGLILAVMTKELRPEHEKLAERAWKSVFNRNYELSYIDFKNHIAGLFNKKVLNGPFNNCAELLREVEYYRWHSYYTLGKIEEKLVYVFVGFDCI